uniref:Uncharacterized protein n=1 Tax=Oryza barthii TaxID=65489 RepID=A0A0D3G742_9ORYZ
MATTPTTTTTTPSATRFATATLPSHGDHADHHHHHPLRRPPPHPPRRRIVRFLLHPRPPAISLSLSRSAAVGCRGHLAGTTSKSEGAGAEENKKGQEQEQQEASAM